MGTSTPITATMRALIVLLACVSLTKAGASIGSSISSATNPTTTSGQGQITQQSLQRMLGLIGSPVGGPFGQAPLQILPANFFSSFNRNQASNNQPLGHFQPFLHQPVVQPQLTAPLKRQVSQAVPQTAKSLSATSAPAGEVAATAESAALPHTGTIPFQLLQAANNPALAHSVFAARSNHIIAAPAAPTPQEIAFENQILAAQANQILGILQPAVQSSQSTDILSNLLPEFIEITNKLEARGITGKGRDQAKDAVEAFMPLMRKMMQSQATLEGRSLTQQEVDAINFAEKTVGPFVTFGYDVSDNGLGFNNPTLPKSDVPNDFFAQMMVDLLPDLTRIVNQVKLRYNGWPGTGSAVEVMNLFVPFARRVVESQARIEGRFITREEQDYLRFGEDTVPILMKYAQEAFLTGKSLETAEKYKITDVVQQAWAQLNKEPRF